MREETRSPEARAAPLFFHIPKSTSAPDDRLAPSISSARLVRKRSCDLRPPTPAILARLASIPIPVKRFTDPEFSLLQCQVNAWNGEPKGASSPDAHGSATSTVLPDTGLLLLPLQSSLRVVGSGEDPMPTT
jgi:hypothetical protein